MSFNWPDIPFSGTEVDAFVVEYKALAESILNDYDEYSTTVQTVETEIDKIILKSPYREKENIKLYLESALVYAAFIVKQRAGNSGPGTDFDLNNSPLKTDISGRSQEEKIKILEALGCIGDNEQMGKSYIENYENDPDGELPPPSDPNIRNALDDFGKRQPDSNCQDFVGILFKHKRDEEELPNCFTQLLADLGHTGSRVLGWLFALQYGLAARYIKGTGGVVQNDEFDGIGASSGIVLDSISASEKFRIETKNVMISARKTNYTNFMGQIRPPSKFSGYAVNLIASDASAYGVPGGRVWQVSSESQLGGLKNVFGDFIVITDGNETIAIDSSMAEYDTSGFYSPQHGRECTVERPCRDWDTETGKAYITSMSYSNIKQIRDDYDFDYGFELRRNQEGDGLPGDSFDNDQIESGPLFETSTSTPCEASDNTSGPAGTVRRLVANNHGTGRTERGDYQDEPCKGKPFAIKLTY